VVERALTGRAAACVAAAFLLAAACACSSQRARRGDGAGAGSQTSGEPAATAVARDGARDGGPGFALANFSGTTLRAVYVSPSESEGWEENILGGDELADGATVAIGFSPDEKAASWDVRVEAVDNHYAEWKGLDLRDVSRITLLLDMVGERVVVAEVE
jgi:hypothetical protein